MEWLKKLLPTHSLFSRVFLWFWLVTILMVASSSYVARTILADIELQPLDVPAYKQFSHYAEQVERGFNQMDSPQVNRDNLITQALSLGLPMFLVDKSSLQFFYATPVPSRPSESLITAFINETIPRRIKTASAIIIGPAPITINGESYAFFSVKPQPFSWMLRRTGAFPVSMPVMMLTLSGFLCFLLVWSLVRPLRHFQAVTQQIAKGNFDIKVNSHAFRQDELDQLGKAINTMSSQIAHQIDVQKRLLADISHELRSPLARQQVALTLARKNAEQQHYAEVDKALNHIEKENDQLNALIMQLLALSKLEGTPEIVKQRVDVNAVLTSIIDDARFEARAKNKQVEEELSHVESIWANEELVYRALENIIRNAVEHATKQVHIAMKVNGNWVAIEIIDDGPGVEESQLDRLFTPFYRLSAARERTSGGVGLGLAIALQAIEKHAGKIIARNNVSINSDGGLGGLTVTVLLPVNGQKHT